MPRAKREARRAKAKARPKETGRTGTRINRPDSSRESVRGHIDGRLVYMNLVPHVQRHIDQVVSSCLRDGQSLTEGFQVAMDECHERHLLNMIAATMDLHEATSDQEYEQDLRAFRATGARRVH